jgi:hypothetical protein
VGHRAEKNRKRHGYRAVLKEKRKHAADVYTTERPPYVKTQRRNNK